jgi:PAS domain S-box-containing protein
VSERHRPEAATADPTADGLLEESLEVLYEDAPCGYLSTTLDGLIVKVNRTFLSWTGYGREEIVDARRLWELFPAGDRIFYQTHYAPLLAMQGAVREIALELVRADGSLLPVIVNASVQRDAEGRPRLVRTTVIDASERREYERELVRARALAESRSRGSLAMAHVTEGVLLVAPDGEVEVMNAAAFTLLDVDEHVLGRPVEEALPGWGEIVGRIPVGPPDRPPAPASLPLARADRELWVAAAGVDSGEGIVYTLRDLSAERRLDEIRDDIVAIASHEFRTPLAGAFGAAKTLLALDDRLEADTRRQLLETVVEQTERLTKIVDDLLVTSSLDAGVFRVEQSVFDAAGVVGRAVAAVGDARRAEMRLEWAVAPGLAVRGDPARTEQALATVIDNAVVYSPEDTPVRVTAEVRRGHARFTVVDQGRGIPPEERERVFEKFYRGDPNQLHGGGGTGLGLYIAREVISRMNGRIEITSSGTGTSVAVELPLA